MSEGQTVNFTLPGDAKDGPFRTGVIEAVNGTNSGAIIIYADDAGQERRRNVPFYKIEETEPAPEKPE